MSSPERLPVKAGPVPDKLTIWPVDDGRYGLDATFQGASGCQHAEHHQQALQRRWVPHTFRQDLGGGWRLRFGPFRAIDIRCGAVRRSCTERGPASAGSRPRRSPPSDVGGSRLPSAGGRDTANGLLHEFGEPTIAVVAKRKPASTVSGEQSDRQLSATISRPTGS